MTSSNGPISWRAIVAVLSALVTGDWTLFQHNHSSTATGGTIGTAGIPSHAITHKDGGSDEVSQVVGGRGAIPKGDTPGTLHSSWFPYGATSTTVCVGNDSRLSDARTPTGAASGDLTGTYPSPTIGAGKVTLAQQANMATASVVYRKTAGTGAPEVQTLATLKTDLGLTGTNSGDQTIGDDYDSIEKVGTTNFEAWYWCNSRTGVATTTLPVVANKAYAIPYVASRRGPTWDRIAIQSAAGGGNVRMALFTESGGIPVTLVVDYGAVAVGAGVTSITISQAHTAGQRYMVCLVFDSTPTIRAISTNAASCAVGTDNTLIAAPNTHITATMTYGAWAGTFPTTGMAAATGPCPGVARRLSV